MDLFIKTENDGFDDFVDCRITFNRLNFSELIPCP